MSPHTEGSVSALLAERHAKDLWVPGCVLGSRTHGCRELDGWALLRTWSPTTTIGYEIKVSRSDWLRDQKVGEYQKRVNLMYVVAPRGIVQVGELPAGCGLLEVPSTGRRLITRAKAVRSEHADDRLLLLYVLMCRAKVVPTTYHETGNGSGSGLAFWKRVAEEREERRAIGHLASKRVAEALRAATREAGTATAERDRWLPAMAALAEFLGMSLDEVRGRWSHELVSMLRQRTGQDIPPPLKLAIKEVGGLLVAVDRCARNLRDALAEASHTGVA